MRQLALSLSLALLMSGSLLGATYQSASIVGVTRQVSTQQHDSMHATLLDSGLITETIIVFQFKIRAGNDLYLSDYRPPQAGQGLPKDLTPQILIRVNGRHLFIYRGNGSELMTKIIEHSVVPNK